MKSTGGDIISNTINWFKSNRLYALLQKVTSDKEQDYYAGKLTPEEEAEMIAFLNQYKDYDNTPAGAQA